MTVYSIAQMATEKHPDRDIELIPLTDGKGGETVFFAATADGGGSYHVFKTSDMKLQNSMGVLDATGCWTHHQMALPSPDGTAIMNIADVNQNNVDISKVNQNIPTLNLSGPGQTGTGHHHSQLIMPGQNVSQATQAKVSALDQNLTAERNAVEETALNAVANMTPKMIKAKEEAEKNRIKMQGQSNKADQVNLIELI